MQIKTLKRMMIDRTIAQKNEVVKVTAKEGQSLIAKGDAVEVEAVESKSTKAETTKPKVKDDNKEKAD